MVSADTIMALVFGLLSSITGVFSALVAYFTLRAMKLDHTTLTSSQAVAVLDSMRPFETILNVLGLVGSPSSPSLPADHPASTQFAAWLAAFNTGDRSTLLEYHNGPAFPYSVASHDVGNIASEINLASASGGFQIADVVSASDPSTIVVVMKEKARPLYAKATMVVDTSKDEYPTTEFNIHPIITPIKFLPEDDPLRPAYAKAMQPLTADTRQALIDGIAEVLRDQYIIPDAIETMVSSLQRHAEHGDYDEITDSVEFSQRLTKDIQSAGQDKHMRIAFLGPPPDLSGSPKKLPPSEIHAHLHRTGFGFQNTTLDQTTIPGRTIATLPITSFIPIREEAEFHAEARVAISKILSGIANADALLVDLRANHGGDPHTVSFILSFLLDDAPLHVLDMVDRAGNVTTSFSTSPPSALPEGSARFGGEKPLYVLTSKETVSGGEEMAYDLQAFQRSRAVIGEGNAATVGAANPVTRPREICTEIFGTTWFVLAPDSQPVHAVTGANWAGAGVQSDIVAGEGEWEGVDDAEEVAKRLVKKIFEVTREERLEL